jgi:lipoic acid synthetase
MPRRHPDWLKVHHGTGPTYTHHKTLQRTSHLHTICEEAKCPNITECFETGTAVFLILGDTCTRGCRYCHVTQAPPHPPDPTEPQHVADSIKTLNLTHAVITSVTRDDLPDGGATHIAHTITAIRNTTPDCTIEALIPDLQGNTTALHTILQAQPDILNHNIEVVKPLFPTIRPHGNYTTSLTLLTTAKTLDPTLTTKSGIMVGLGETNDQLHQAFHDLNTANVDILTIGQYLQPTTHHEPVHRYYTPQEFQDLRTYALTLGFKAVEAGPLVRSSYHAQTAYHHSQQQTLKNNLQETPPTTMQTQTTYKEPNGKLLRLFLDYNPQTHTITKIKITGDFFAYPDNAIDLIEESLPDTPINHEALLNRINQTIDQHHLQLLGLTPEGLTQAILRCLP